MHWIRKRWIEPWWILSVAAAFGLAGCRVAKEIQAVIEPEPVGLNGLRQKCMHADTVRSVLIQKAEALLEIGNERYEATVSLFIRRDSIIYLSAVGSGFEIIRASVDRDSIKVIDRLNRTVYRTPLKKKFGYQHPVDFEDFQNVMSSYFLCDEIQHAEDRAGGVIAVEYDGEWIKKRILLAANTLKMRRFEFYHARTNEYIMGERTEEGLTLFLNFIVSDFTVRARQGEIYYNRDLEIRMDVNPKRYGFVDI